jgi:hypothetical protein
MDRRPLARAAHEEKSMISERQNQWIRTLWRGTAFTWLVGLVAVAFIEFRRYGTVSPWLGMLLALNVGPLWVILFPVSRKK